MARHPLRQELVQVVLEAWKDIFETRIGARGYRIGIEIKPSPQIMATFLHELIPLVFQDRHPGEWCRERHGRDKDLVCIADPAYSIEIKASSHTSKIFGNRSYAQQPTSALDLGKKGKSGYYLAINFEKFSSDIAPRVVQIRFGWLDHSDWIAQRTTTGQQAHVAPHSDATKLVKLYPTP